ncbi:sulfotransferase [bacterium]|nr:sulfotransferase [bacterium]
MKKGLLRLRRHRKPYRDRTWLRLFNFLAKKIAADNYLDAIKDYFKFQYDKNPFLDMKEDHYVFGPLKILLNELRGRHVTPLGRSAITRAFNESIYMRIRLKRYLRSHPEVLNTEIKKPIFVMGLPRSGTTYLQNIIIQFFNRRGLRFWELIEPVPYSKFPTLDKNTRILKAFIIFLLYKISTPKLQLLHPLKLYSFEECWYLFRPTFSVYNYIFQFGVEDYGKFLLSHCMDKAYEDYREFLQILSCHKGNPDLVLKCPEHMLFMESITRTFPDACLIWIHRDPFKSIPSYSSMIYEAQRFYFGYAEKRDVGKFVTDEYYKMTEKARDFWRNNPTMNLLNVTMSELRDNPGNIVKKIADRFGIKPLTEPATPRGTNIIKNLRRLKSRKKYKPEDFGLYRGDIHSIFRGYMNEFKLAAGS